MTADRDLRGPHDGAEPPARLLIVEDDPELGRALSAAAARDALDTRVCATVAEARRLLAGPPSAWWPDLLLLDLRLPDGSALELLQALPPTMPRPCVIAMSGGARPEQSFALALLGVRHFLTKPVDSADEVLAILRQARQQAPDLIPQIRATVGLRPVHEVEAEVRRIMIGEAMVRTGSVRGAARLLAVSRQLLQHMLRALRGEP